MWVASQLQEAVQAVGPLFLMRSDPRISLHLVSHRHASNEPRTQVSSSWSVKLSRVNLVVLTGDWLRPLIASHSSQCHSSAIWSSSSMQSLPLICYVFGIGSSRDSNFPLLSKHLFADLRIQDETVPLGCSWQQITLSPTTSLKWGSNILSEESGFSTLSNYHYGMVQMLGKLGSIRWI